MDLDFGSSPGRQNALALGAAFFSHCPVDGGQVLSTRATVQKEGLGLWCASPWCLWGFLVITPGPLERGLEGGLPRASPLVAGGEKTLAGRLQEAISKSVTELSSISLAGGGLAF